MFDHFWDWEQWNLAKSWNFDKVALEALLKIEIFDFAGTGNKKIWQSLESLSRVENFAKNWDFLAAPALVTMKWTRTFWFVLKIMLNIEILTTLGLGTMEFDKI